MEFTRKLTVVAEVHDDFALCEDDEGIPGSYTVLVDPTLSDAEAASCALDVFHSNVAIDELDPFCFSVFDGERELEEDPEHENYSLSAFGEMA